MDWFNNKRLLEPIGNMPPAEAEARYDEQREEPAMAARRKQNGLPQTRGGSDRKAADDHGIRPEAPNGVDAAFGEAVEAPGAAMRLGRVDIINASGKAPPKAISQRRTVTAKPLAPRG